MGKLELIVSTFIFISFVKFHIAKGESKMRILDSGFSDPDSIDIMPIERVNRLNNKTVKILTGQLRPGPPQQSPQRPIMQNNYYPNGNYPQSPDLSGQGSGPKPNFQQQPDQSHMTNPHRQGEASGVPEVYLQIIGAIEKLVGRLDKMDARLATVENIVYHLTNANNKKDQPQQGNCPENFIKMDGVRGKCFHVSTLVGSKSVFDWQTAHADCRKMGGRLAEMIIYDDFLRISQFLIKYGAAKNGASADFWIGGINPGLIWIWSESGQQVEMDKRFWNTNDNSSNAPGCLKLSYSNRLDAFFFKGAPCSHSQNILCEIMDNTVSRALASFEQDLITEELAENNNTSAEIIS